MGDYEESFYAAWRQPKGKGDTGEKMVEDIPHSNTWFAFIQTIISMFILTYFSDMSLYRATQFSLKLQQTEEMSGQHMETQHRLSDIQICLLYILIYSNLSIILWQVSILLYVQTFVDLLCEQWLNSLITLTSLSGHEELSLSPELWANCPSVFDFITESKYRTGLTQRICWFQSELNSENI